MRCLLLVLLAAGFWRTLGGATVTGRVLDQHGRPVVGAKVTLSLSGRSGVFPTTETDATGHFVFSDVFSNLTGAQLVDLEAEKEDEFLISPRVYMLGFPAGGHAPRFQLRPDETVEGLTIQFGPPGGRLVIRFEGDQRGLWQSFFKYRVSRPGKPPPVKTAFYTYEAMVPAGDYEIRIFDLEDRFVAQTIATVESGKTTKVRVKIPAQFVPKEPGGRTRKPAPGGKNRIHSVVDVIDIPNKFAKSADLRCLQPLRQCLVDRRGKFRWIWTSPKEPRRQGAPKEVPHLSCPLHSEAILVPELVTGR